MFKQNIYWLLLIALLCSCRREIEKPEVEKPMQTGNEPMIYAVPKGMPYPEVPNDNLPTKNRIALGKQLFFDPILSRDSTISCGSCHLENNFFQDNMRLSAGIQQRLGQRNTPSIVNIAYIQEFFWDGGVASLDQQILAPIENPLEMDFDIVKVVERLQRNPVYVDKFKQAYDKEPSVYTLTRAISCFERSLIGGKSRYDRFLQNKDTSALTASELHGEQLFFNEKGDCFHCHTGFNFTDNSFRNNGIYEVYADSGRAHITGFSLDVGRFRVPSLRNVAKTAPYMHDGSFASLEQVIDHYNSGGKKHPNKSSLLRPLGLSEQDKQDLINFLGSLSDD
jgi:cytochrome c peroxidase